MGVGFGFGFGFGLGWLSHVMSYPRKSLAETLERAGLAISDPCFGLPDMPLY